MEEERVPMLAVDEQALFTGAEHPYYGLHRPRSLRRSTWLAIGTMSLAVVAIGVLVTIKNAFLDQNAAMQSPSMQHDDYFLMDNAAITASDIDWRSKCHERYFTQPLDHFVGITSPVSKDATYEERVFVCTEHSKPDGAIFFYAGNEADVELYLNNTGLMWENAAEFGAMVVFAEHRYFGKSVPFGDKVKEHMQFLSSTQALADYAVLIRALKDEFKLDVPVIVFGGSYGGMLASWFRMKYPNVVDGAIAGSAPIAAFLGDTKPVDMESFGRVVTFDASVGGGSSANCVPNVRRAWQVLTDMGKTAQGRHDIGTSLHLCETIDTQDDVQGVIAWASDAFNYLAMGNYPYPSPYILNGKGVLPAYPVRAACSHLNDSYGEKDSIKLLHALHKAIGVYYNSSGDQPCFNRAAPSNESARDGDFWQYLYCSELYMPTMLDGINDMFIASPWNQSADNASCVASSGVSLRPQWAMTEYGGGKALAAASNIVLSNGNYDPWSGTGILVNVSDSVVAVPVEGGAHHLDLFFSHPLDPPSVKQARAIEKQFMWQWVREFYASTRR